ESYFDVARESRRPFVVEVGTNEIRAIGTAFNVRAASDRVVVSVTEGKVAVAAREKKTPAVMFAAGELAEFAPDGLAREKSSAPHAPTWLQGRFEYQGEELRQVVADLNRYTDRPIVLADASLGALRYSGTVFPAHLDEWLQGIGGALPVAVRDEGRE